MKTLLDDRFVPITDQIGFLDCPLDRLAAFELPTHRDFDKTYQCEYFVADLSDALFRLQPLRRGRTLLIQTQSHWTAVLSDDPTSIVIGASQKLRCRGVKATYVEDKVDKKTGEGMPGSVQMFVFAGIDDSSKNYLRAISVTHPPSGWDWHESYSPLPFERVERYMSRPIRDRFDHDLLEEYCLHFGIRLFDESFYGGHCALLYSTLPRDPSESFITYESAQAVRGKRAIVP